MSATVPWDAARVARCARLSNLAYSTDVPSPSSAASAGVEGAPIRITTRGGTLPCADVWRAPATREVIVAFRGSSTLDDLRVTADARLLPLPLPMSTAQAHAGCLSYWADMGEAVEEAVRRQRALLPVAANDAHLPRLVLTGHSLGGMLAVLATVLLPGGGGGGGTARRSCVTFGAPRVGDAAFVDVFRNAVHHDDCEGVRFVFDRDPIPRYPCDPAYRHAGDLAWYQGSRADVGGRMRVRASARARVRAEVIASPFAATAAQAGGGGCGGCGGACLACLTCLAACLGCACGVRDALLDATDHRTAGYITVADRLQRGTVVVEPLKMPTALRWWRRSPLLPRGRWPMWWRPDS